MLNPFKKSFLLFLPGNVEKEFDDDYPVCDKVLFKGVDFGKPPLPYSVVHRCGDSLPRVYLRMNPHDQGFFVMGSVENPNPPPLGQRLE